MPVLRLIRLQVSFLMLYRSFFNILLFRSSCNPADTKNKRRKRIQRDNWMIVPRVVKSDIRRLYAQMFVNILNSQDINLLRSFLRTYASKSITLSTVCSCGKNPFSANLRGRDLITCLSAAQFQVSPDRIHAIDNVQIISNSANRECKIRCNVSSTFTILFTITLENIIEQITKTFHPQTIDQTIPNGSVNISSKTMSMPDNPRREIGTLRSSQDFYDIFRCFPGGASSVLARTPRVLACTMKMVLDVDENKQIKFITLAH